MAILGKLIYRFTTIPIKFQLYFFIENDKVNFKKTQNSHNILTKKKLEVTHFLISKLSTKLTVMNAVWYCH